MASTQSQEPPLAPVALAPGPKQQISFDIVKLSLGHYESDFYLVRLLLMISCCSNTQYRTVCTVFSQETESALVPTSSSAA